MNRRKSSQSLLSRTPVNEGRCAMLARQRWIVCEPSGRWAAALRVTFARSPHAESLPQLYEVRSLIDLAAQVEEHRNSLALMEVGESNLTKMLELLARDAPQRPRWCVAMLDNSLSQQDLCDRFDAVGDRRKQEIIDALWEAGVVEVVESPRHVKRLLTLYDRMAQASCAAVGRPGAQQAVADWAWSILPWQDA
jgi:hypothetical protein